MKLHEERCFKNPARKWPNPDIEPHKIALADVDHSTEAAVIAALSDAVDGCPACILATIIQATLPTSEWSDVDGERSGSSKYWIQWDYKKARDEYRSEQMAEERGSL
jgi:hypothetical protein